MSRYVINFENNKQFVYGCDHALGYFYELWDNNKGEFDHEKITHENSQFFGRMKNKEMASMMIQNRANPDHIDMVLKNMPF